MGFWDAVSSTAESAKNAGRTAYSAVAGKSTAYLGAPIAGILRSSYDHGRSALSAVDGAVRGERAQRVKESIPDKEVLAKIGWNITNVALDSYSRSFTGGLPVYKIMVDGLKKSNKLDDLEEMRNRIQQLEAMLAAAQGAQPLGYPTSGPSHQKPDDVIRIFTTKGLACRNFVDDQVILLHEKWRKDALLCLCPVVSSVSEAGNA